VIAMKTSKTIRRLSKKDAGSARRIEDRPTPPVDDEIRHEFGGHALGVKSADGLGR